MAGYLPTQFPGDYYSGDEAKSLDFIGYFDNQRQKESARQNQEINRQMALEDLYAKQAERPLKEQRLSLENQGLAALLPEKQAKGKQAQRDWEVEEGVPVEQRRQALMGKIAREIQDDELKRYESEVKRMISDPMVLRNPNAKAIAEQLYGLLPEIRKMREGFQSKEDIAAMRAEMEREKQEAITARAAEARARDKAAFDSMQIEINKKRTATEKVAQIRAFLGMLAPDDPKRMALMRQEAELIPMVNAENKTRTAGRQEVDLEAGGLRSPQGITLAPRDGASKPDPLGIR